MTVASGQWNRRHSLPEFAGITRVLGFHIFDQVLSLRERISCTLHDRGLVQVVSNLKKKETRAENMRLHLKIVQHKNPRD